MKQDKLALLEQTFCDGKIFVNNGYYRIRTLSDDEKEIAYLVSDPCGATTVHPQITIEKREDEWIATKFIDLEVTPTQRLYREPETEALLDDALESLITQFEEAVKCLTEEA